ncbi:2-methylaconitate cis-trans isomerase PrpF family protein [Priestia aryabhattai]|uniref:3-methylitaconate isomerase n=1 Tax=Priestia megaterium TaxID=1404 RepID=A0AA86I569_PRIMG|nr:MULTISPECIES: PrpF domain-containing protein [Priestia]AXI30715.1 3-methylitaconate isomerase [Priestia megaterium]MBX9968119.1 3-methylitaconate isomerase [Priestia aryabhattai]MBZ6486261.1 3-methylitaconate isomerase [Priestia aryabhattai]MDH3113248.1 PrpF domain-containing protein [Priestia aryabhattai]MDH3127845.1 PrpF domain-containing protein [Priestia aryabhattai]
MTRIPVTVMRGGTSKGVFINHEEMPVNKSDWEPFLLDIMGSPDQRQIDGLGGANSLTSKIAIIKKSDLKEADVDYTFAQVSISESLVDFKGNCGNISSAVGPYAIEQGLVQAVEPVTKVRIYNTNTKKVIVAEVEVENGKVKTEGECMIPGVPGTGSPIYLSFENGEGAVTGKLLPTGNAIDLLQTSIGTVKASIVDVGNPLVFVKAADIGLKGTELPHEYTDKQLKLFEEIRSIAAEKAGLAPQDKATKLSPAVPKMTIIAPPMDHRDGTGREKAASEMDVLIRMMSMQKPHQTLAITGAICTTAAIYTKGTLVSEMVQLKGDTVRLAHPMGIMETSVDLKDGQVNGIKVVRTARLIFEGFVYTKHTYDVCLSS